MRISDWSSDVCSSDLVSPGLTLPSLDQTAAEFATVARENLLQRPIDAEAIGDAVAYLLEAPSVTGQNLFVDNGQRFLPRTSDAMFRSEERRVGYECVSKCRSMWL